MKIKSMLGLVVIVAVVTAVIFAGCIENEISVPTPKQESTVGWKYNNPAPPGNTILSTSKAFQITAIKIERGPQVNKAIAEANEFNDPPHVGNEYMFVQIGFEYMVGDQKYPLWRDDFKVYVNDVALESPYVVLPDDHPEIFQTDVMPGGKVEKWLCFEVPVGEDVILAYDRGMDYPVYYFEVA